MNIFQKLSFLAALLAVPIHASATPSRARGVDAPSRASTAPRMSLHSYLRLAANIQMQTPPQIPAAAPAAPPQVPAAAPPPIPAAGPATPPPVPAQKPLVYYVVRNGKPYGPLTLQQMADEIKAGRVTRSTLTWQSGDPSWTPACQLPALSQICNLAPPRVPAKVKWQRFMIGTWRYSLQNPEGLQDTRETVTMTFRPGGAYNGVMTMQMGYNPPVAKTLNGRWSVQAIGNGGEFTLTTTNVGSYMGQTSTLRRINHNLVANDAQGYQARRVSGY